MTTQKSGKSNRRFFPFGGGGKAVGANDTYALVAEFDDADDLVAAAQGAYALGYRRMDAYSPFPIEELPEMMGFRTRLPMVVLIGGLSGAILGYLFQYWVNLIDYPINIGGRPDHSWPAFIPAIFELTILFAAFAATFGMILLNGLPRLHHPIFNTPNFEQASRDKFFLGIEADDPMFDLQRTKEFLESTGPTVVSEVKN